MRRLKRAFTLAEGADARQIGNKKRLFAFTLAEVLITLMVIGVVAALTIPTLYAAWQKQTYVVGLKKMYATLQEGVKRAYVMNNCNFGDTTCINWDKSSKLNDNDDPLKARYDIDGFNALSKVLNTSAICNYGNVDSACSQLKGFSDYEVNDDFKKVYIYSPIMILQDGTYISFNKTYKLIYADVNGAAKGPNVGGRDIFAFKIVSETKTCSNGYKAVAGTVLPMGSHEEVMYAGCDNGNSDTEYWKVNNYCSVENLKTDVPGNNLLARWFNTNDLYYGAYCTGRVLEENAMNY